MWCEWGGAVPAPDADTWLSTLWGPNAGMKGNVANFKQADYHRIYEKERTMPDSPESTKRYEALAKIVISYAPCKINVNRILTDMWHPQLVGYRRPLVQRNTIFRHLALHNAHVA